MAHITSIPISHGYMSEKYSSEEESLDFSKLQVVSSVG